MKIRIFSALVGLVILAAVLYLFDTLVLNVVIGLICIIAVLELLKATGCTQHPSLTGLSIIMTLILPFARWVKVRPMLLEILFIMIILFFLLLIKSQAVIRIEQITMSFFFSTVVPVFFSCAVYMRDDFGATAGIFYLLLALGSAWLCDTCAYFTGIKFGKHKLAPVISPKKTVEGAIGGVVFGSLLMLGLGFLFVKAVGIVGITAQIQYLPLLVCTPVFAIIGMLGDLSASVIKRQFGVKDYGQIMPGHGGIMDRFDSVLFTLPTVYIVVQHVELIRVVA